MAHQEKLQEYDEEPIKYCTRCYSLKIGYEDAIDTEYCMECGCSDIAEASIYRWESMYKNRYGHEFLTRNKDPKKSLVYKMPYDKLKEMVNTNPNWKKIIYRMYPKFPRKYNRAETIMLFFDQLAKDNRIDELRILLTEMF